MGCSVRTSQLSDFPFFVRSYRDAVILKADESLQRTLSVEELLVKAARLRREADLFRRGAFTIRNTEEMLTARAAELGSLAAVLEYQATRLAFSVDDEH